MHTLLKPLWIASFLFVTTAAASRADFVTDTLGSAGPGNYALLSLTGATDIALNGPGTTTGNVGISSPGRLALDSSNGNPPVAIKGDVYLGNTRSRAPSSFLATRELALPRRAAASVCC